MFFFHKASGLSACVFFFGLGHPSHLWVESCRARGLKAVQMCKELNGKHLGFAFSAFELNVALKRGLFV